MVARGWVDLRARPPVGVKANRHTLPELLALARQWARNVRRLHVDWWALATLAVVLIGLGVAWPDLLALLD